MESSRRRNTRRKMIWMLSMSMALVVALGTSTMAWYSVNTSISVNSNTVSIRTALQYDFYAYKGNGFTNGDKIAANYKAGSGYNNVPEDFPLKEPNSYTVIDALKFLGEAEKATEKQQQYYEAMTSAAGLWPGYKMTFAVKIMGLQWTDNQHRDEPVLKAISANIQENKGASKTKKIKGSQDAYITMADAIKLTAGCGADLPDAITAHNSSTITSGTNYRNYNSDGKITPGWYSGADLNLGQAKPTKDNSEWWYVFTIEFSNHNTTYYIDEGNNVFEESTDGNSSCYEGLTFGLGTMELK